MPYTVSREVVSSLDVFPTVSALAGVRLPPGVVYDGVDVSDVLLESKGKSKQRSKRAHLVDLFSNLCMAS